MLVLRVKRQSLSEAKGNWQKLIDLETKVCRKNHTPLCHKLLGNGNGSSSFTAGKKKRVLMFSKNHFAKIGTLGNSSVWWVSSEQFIIFKLRLVIWSEKNLSACPVLPTTNWLLYGVEVAKQLLSSYVWWKQNLVSRLEGVKKPCSFLYIFLCCTRKNLVTVYCRFPCKGTEGEGVTRKLCPNLDNEHRGR